MFQQTKSVLLLCILFVLSFFASSLKAEVVSVKSDRAPLVVTPHTGDTLWGLADKYYGHPKYYPLIMAENGIENARRLIAGKSILIPVLPNGTPGKALHPMRSYLLSHPLLPVVSHEEITETVKSNGLMIESYENAGLMPFSATPEPAAPTMVQPAQIQSAVRKRITGYQIRVLGESAQVIPLRRRLTACIIRFDSRKQNCHYSAWAEQSGDTVILTASIRVLPQENFALVVDGMHNRIDGEAFTANATPLYGRLPGPRRFTVFLQSAGGALARGAIAGAMTGNPFIGVGVAVAPYAFHGVEAVVKSLKQ